MGVLIEIQKKIDKLIGIHGSDKVLDYLNDFDINYNLNGSKELKAIKNEVLAYYGIDEDQLSVVNTKSTNARRIIAWYLANNTNFSSQQIVLLINICLKTYYQYIKYVDYLLKNPSTDKDFFEDIITISLSLKNK